MEINQKITMPALVALLAVKSGVSKEESEKFIESFFSLISDSLEAGESVKIKGLGTFKVVPVENRKSVNISDGSDITIPGHNKVVFVPSREIAEKVNAPFSMFESVELYSESVMETEEEEIEPEVINEEQEDEEIITEAESESVETEEEEHYEESIVETGIEKKKTGVFRFLMGFACGLAAAIIICLGGYYFFLRDVIKTGVVKESEAIIKGNSPTSNNISSEVVVSDTVGDGDLIKEAPETEPSEMVVYDTIGKQRYLTTMAQDHYGSFNLWPYIYEENKASLGHPDRIKPGTQVVIPNLEKYGVDPKNPEDIKKAKAKGVAIYNRYR